MQIPILTAPTAAGKTALTATIAQSFPLEIVSADAFTVYRGLDIGTAKPSIERKIVTHHLIDVVDVTEYYDVVRYVHEAQTAIASIISKGAKPLIVGAAGFYLSALIRGLPQTPPADLKLRAEIESELSIRGLDALLKDIQSVNPQEVIRLQRNPRRTVRSLEVYRQTGRFPGEFGYSSPKFNYRIFAFSPAWPELELQIQARIFFMLENGWPKEAAWLAARLSPDTVPTPTAWQALGYREALAVYAGELSLEEALERITLTTRQYAKRQLTWIRTQLGAKLVSPKQAAVDLSDFLAKS